ncbi:MAG: TonB-dependent receptor [Kordiimonadaceae bacterium]|nr:TonB-dependent receptor [Kordiimonadaceae bacterium]
MRYGSATSGDLDDIQVGQAFGTTWSTGHALISYDYQRRDNLDTNDRAFTRDQPDPSDILPRQERNSVFLTAGQSLSDGVEVFGDAFYSKRRANIRQVLGTVANELIQKTEQYGASLGLQAALGANWQSELVGSFSQNDLSSLTGSGSVDSTSSTTWSLEGKVDGSLLVLPGGDVKLAAGGQVRRETFKEVRSSLTEPGVDADRTIYAFFSEIFVPLVGKDNRKSGIERLELTVAGRYENYNDFGSSTDSKLGLLWSPIEGVNLRGTYGTSFRAPLFRELFGAVGGFFLPFPDPSSPSGSTLAVFGQGSNPNLQPEAATTWTAGFDIAPPSLPNLSIRATYFNISFNDRISTAGALFDALSNPRWAFLVDRSPDPALLAFFEAQPESLNFTGDIPFTEAGALIDERLRNLSSVLTRGLDANLSYALGSDVGSFVFNLASTYLFEQSEQVLTADIPVDIVGTVRNPPNLKLRGSINWSYEGFSTNLAVNYIDGFRNDQVSPVVNVSSWTTVDMNINYSIGDDSSSKWLDNTVFSISALNLFDRDPPFAASGSFDLDFDIANANALGLTIAFQITKQW